MNKFCLQWCGKSAAVFRDRCKEKLSPPAVSIFDVFGRHIYFVYFNIWPMKQPKMRSAMSISILIILYTFSTYLQNKQANGIAIATSIPFNNRYPPSPLVPTHQVPFSSFTILITVLPFRLCRDCGEFFDLLQRLTCCATLGLRTVNE